MHNSNIVNTKLNSRNMPSIKTLKDNHDNSLNHAPFITLDLVFKQGGRNRHGHIIGTKDKLTVVGIAMVG